MPLLFVLLSLPRPASAHDLSARPAIPLPLEIFLAGAMIAVALSFALVLTYEGRWRPGPATRVRRLPRPIRSLLRAAGLLAWAWIVAQLVVGGTSDGDVARLFTWVYGWVGLAMACALVAPLWAWLDPFLTLHDLSAWVGHKLWRGRAGRAIPAPHSSGSPAGSDREPEGARTPTEDGPLPAVWPAVALFTLLVWLELVVRSADMHHVVVGYTVLTLGGMAWVGRDRWRARAEVFGVWFGMLGRMAWWAPVGAPEDGRVRHRRFPDGLLAGPWDRSRVTLVAVATGAILYDGLSLAVPPSDLLGTAGIVPETLGLAVFLAIIVVPVLVIGRAVGLAAVGAGLLPISVGYLIAHYLTYLLLDGQKILIAIADPLQQGLDLTGTAFLEPSIAWLSPVVVWLIMFSAVVGGHALGAWAGHLRPDVPDRPIRRGRTSQLALVLLMVALTTFTLWSLGQPAYQARAVDVRPSPG